MLRSLQEINDSKDDLIKDFVTRADFLKQKLKKISASELSLEEFQELKKLQEDIDSVVNAVGKNNAGTSSNKRDLGANFAFSKVEEISIEGNVFKTKSYTEMLVTTCKFLMQKDKNTFIRMTKDLAKNFSNQARPGKDSKEITTGIFVNTKYSATDIVRLIKRLLNYYNIDVSINNVYIKTVN